MIILEDSLDLTGLAKKEHKHKKADITDFPTSMPASDVYAWAKEPNKPTYNAKEVDAIPDSDTPSFITFTLLASNWVNNEYILNNSFFNAGNYSYLVAPDPMKIISVYGKAGIVAQVPTTNGQFKFTCTKVPTEDIIVNIIKTKIVEFSILIDNAKLKVLTRDNHVVQTISYKMTPNPAVGTDISKAQDGSVKVVDINGDGTELQIQSKTDKIALEADASWLFDSCNATTIDVSHFDTSQVTKMAMIFCYLRLTTLDLSSFDTSKVTDMYGMFRNVKSTSIDLSSFDTSNVTLMGEMFNGCQATTLDLSSFDTSKVINMDEMFWHTKATVGYGRTQEDCDRFNASSGKPESLTFVVKGSKTLIDNPKLQALTQNNSTVQTISYKITPTPATGTDISKAQDGSVQVVDINGDGTELQIQSKTDKIVLEETRADCLFCYCAATTIDLSHFDTSNVTDMNRMFTKAQATTLDLGSFDTSKVTNMQGMFTYSQATTLDLSSFDTSNVTDMSFMFAYSQATTLDLSSFDTSKVTNMKAMFYGAQATTLDLSSFDTSNVTNMWDMFNGAKATIGYGRTQADCDKFNSSEGKPTGLNFVVKPTA